MFCPSVACQPNHPGGITNMKLKDQRELCGKGRDGDITEQKECVR